MFSDKFKVLAAFCKEKTVVFYFVKDTRLNVGTSDKTRCVKVYANKFSLKKECVHISICCTVTIKIFIANLKKKIKKKTKPRLTNREELSFLTVFALPNASKIGLASNNCLSNSA